MNNLKLISDVLAIVLVVLAILFQAQQSPGPSRWILVFLLIAIALKLGLITNVG